MEIPPQNSMPGARGHMAEKEPLMAKWKRKRFPGTGGAGFEIEHQRPAKLTVVKSQKGQGLRVKSTQVGWI